MIPVYPDELVDLLCEDIAYNKGGMLKVLARIVLSLAFANKIIVANFVNQR